MMLEIIGLRRPLRLRHLGRHQNVNSVNHQRGESAHAKTGILKRQLQK